MSTAGAVRSCEGEDERQDLGAFVQTRQRRDDHRRLSRHAERPRDVHEEGQHEHRRDFRALGRLMTAWLTVVGIGEDGWDGLGAAARQAIADARVLVGGERHLALVGRQSERSHAFHADPPDECGVYHEHQHGELSAARAGWLDPAQTLPPKDSRASNPSPRLAAPRRRSRRSSRARSSSAAASRTRPTGFSAVCSSPISR